MKPSDDLHQLIHALTPGEKRYFRMFSRMQEQGTDKHYLELFEVLQDMPEFDAAALEERWGDVRKHRLAADKHYLYDQILKAMRLLHAESTARNRSQGALMDSMFLYSKTLFSQSRKFLDKSRKLASKVEYYGALVEVLQLERLLIKRLRVSNRKAWMQRMIAEKKVLMEELVHVMECHDLYDQVLWVAQEDIMPQPSEALAEVARELEKLEAHPGSHQGFRARHLLIQTRAAYERLRQNSQGALELNRELIAHWEAHPEMIREEPFKYQTILCNYLGFCCNAGEFSDFESIRDRIHGFQGNSSHERFELYQNTHYYNLLYVLNSCRFAQGQVLFPEIEAWFQTARGALNIGREFAFRYNFALLCFILEDSKRALYWVNDILNEGRAEVRMDTQRLARIMQLILHYERGNWEAFEALLRPAQRYMKQHARESQTERALIAFLRTLHDLPAGESVRQAFLDFQALLGELEANDVEDVLQVPQEIRIWVEARVNQCSLVEAAVAIKNGEWRMKN